MWRSHPPPMTWPARPYGSPAETFDALKIRQTKGQGLTPGGTGTDDGSCLKALAEPQVRCLFEGFKTKIGGRFFNLRPASDALE